ncbi:MAG TPA: alpha/beta fold hydrolase [Actinomycetota bacterium]
MRQHGRWLERPWGRMRVWEAGRADAMPLLAIHGLGGSGRYWQGLADAVGDRYRVIAPDLAGFGRSDEPQADADRAFHLTNLDALIADTVDPARALVVVGHSLGGVLAALWAARRVERVTALALAAPSFPSGGSMDFRSRADLRASPARRAVAGGVRVIWPLVAVPFGLVRGYPPATVIDFGRQSVRSRAWTLWSLWSDPDLVDEVAAAAAAVDRHVSEVLVVHARDDRTVRFEAHVPWVRLLPRARDTVLDHGGHQFLLKDRFEPVAGWLLELPGPS